MTPQEQALVLLKMETGECGNRPSQVDARGPLRTIRPSARFLNGGGKMVACADDILGELQRRRDTLTGFGVVRLFLFGSFLHDEAKPTSDVDLLVDFDGDPTFDRYMDLYLDDIVTACGKILHYVTGLDFKAFLADGRTYDAVLLPPPILAP